MYLLAVLIVIVLLLVAAVAALNWPIFIALIPVKVGVAEIQMPLGLLLLTAIGIVCGLFLAIIVMQQAGVILELRRSAKALNLQRQLADKAEASRFTELRAFIEAEVRRLRQHAEEQSRSVAAHVGEVEDKLDRVLPPPRA